MQQQPHACLSFTMTARGHIRLQNLAFVIRMVLLDHAVPLGFAQADAGFRVRGESEQETRNALRQQQQQQIVRQAGLHMG